VSGQRFATPERLKTFNHYFKVFHFAKWLFLGQKEQKIGKNTLKCVKPWTLVLKWMYQLGDDEKKDSRD